MSMAEEGAVGELGDQRGSDQSDSCGAENSLSRVPDCLGSGPLLVGADRFELSFPPLDNDSHRFGAGSPNETSAQLRRTRSAIAAASSEVVHVGGDVDHVRALFESDHDRVLDLSDVDLVVEGLRGTLGDLCRTSITPATVVTVRVGSPEAVLTTSRPTKRWWIGVSSGTEPAPALRRPGRGFRGRPRRRAVATSAVGRGAARVEPDCARVEDERRRRVA